MRRPAISLMGQKRTCEIAEIDKNVPA